MAREDLSPHDSICSITERPHVVKPVPDSALLQCEACQDLFPLPANWGGAADPAPDAQDSPESAAALQGEPKVVGRISVDPESNQAFVELTPEALRGMMTAVMRELATTHIPAEIPSMIAMTMLGVMYLKRLGMDHNNIMQVTSIAFNGDVTGLFILSEEKPEEETRS